MFPLSLVKIGQTVNKWESCLEIQAGGGRQHVLRLLRFFDGTDVF